mgnify:CR=1 FL=1
MKTATFFEGVLIALIVGFISSVLLLTLSSFFPGNILIRGLISGISVAYIAYLLTRSNERVGRIIVMTALLISITTMWFAWPPITLFILGHMTIIWLVRSLYFYSSLVSSLADLALNGSSLLIAFAVAGHTNSLFLTLWCFFLMQALFVLIPKSIAKPLSNSSSSTPLNNEEDFQQSFRAAQAAVQQLSIKQ